MNISELSAWIFQHRSAIDRAQRTAIDWDTWLKVELAMWQRAEGNYVLREVPHLEDESGASASLLVRTNEHTVALEVLGESPTYFDEQFLEEMKNKVHRLGRLADAQRYLVAIAYSWDAIQKLHRLFLEEHAFHIHVEYNAYKVEGRPIAVLLLHVKEGASYWSQEELSETITQLEKEQDVTIHTSDTNTIQENKD